MTRRDEDTTLVIVRRAGCPVQPHTRPPVLDDPGLITGAGADPTASVALGAVLEVFLIIANAATAVVVYPILKRQSEIGAIGYVSARLVEGIFIAIGIVSLLAFLLMRQEATADAALGEAFVAIYYRGFLVGPGFAGLANGVILGYLMYRSGLVPRRLATDTSAGTNRGSIPSRSELGVDPGASSLCNDCRPSDQYHCGDRGWRTAEVGGQTLRRRVAASGG